ncbi:MAG TPA: adenylate/guanylate cyclase domain-containing protein [Dongiaceae bacterium]|nr:adenylate/guanylate cyclase domain-containing protein [Dongiaceae bacterium]
MAEAQRRSWSWECDHPPAVIWPLMADTARVNEASGLPLHKITETPQADGSVLTTGEVKIRWVDLKWRELPVNWIAEQWFEHNRVFQRGPLRFLGAELRLIPTPRGTTLTYRVTATPANWFGRLLLKTGFFPAIERSYGGLVAAANAFASGAREQMFPFKAPEISPALRQRIDQIVAAIEVTPHGHGLARRLADYVLTAQEVDLWHLRPLALARLWQRPALQVIELCLQAVREGLLELRWDLLCPGCRGAKAWSGTLDRLPSGAHCPSCNIDYDRDFSQNVEASFRPSAAIRPLEAGEYCMWGPMSVPHVKAQISLAAGETRDVPIRLAPGPYRLRSLEPGPAAEVDWAGEEGGQGFPAATYFGDSVGIGPPAAPGHLRLSNRSARPLTAVLEERQWVAEALTADRVTALQVFRDLFSADVLRPGDDVAVGHIALLFTDLKGSTALYRRIGDAAAYRLVRNHFAFLTEVVRDHEGSVVKTIGDAVMAAFCDDHQAVKAALAIQGRVAAFNRENGLVDGLVIKLGIHAGPTIAVTLNDRLDYFGSVVNMASRLQGQSLGGDLVLSEEVAADPSVAALLGAYAVLRDRAHLKGFEQPQPFLRIRI